MSGCRGCEGALYGCPWEDEDISDCDDKAVIERMTKLAYRTGRADALDEFLQAIPDCDFVGVENLVTIAERIKEQKND